MPNSLKTKLSKLRHKCQITDEEYQELIAKLDGHDAEIRADERRKLVKYLVKHSMICDCFGVDLLTIYGLEKAVKMVLDEYEEARMKEVQNDQTERYS